MILNSWPVTGWLLGGDGIQDLAGPACQTRYCVEFGSPEAVHTNPPALATGIEAASIMQV